MTANNYATQQDLMSLKNEVFQLVSIVKKDNEELKQSQQTTLNLVKQLQQTVPKGIQQMDKGSSFYGAEQNAQGGPKGSTWVINDPARIMAYRASKAAVDPADYYDCKNKILVDYYGRQVSQNTLPIWTCEGDNPEIAIEGVQATVQENIMFLKIYYNYRGFIPDSFAVSVNL